MFRAGGGCTRTRGHPRLRVSVRRGHGCLVLLATPPLLLTDEGAFHALRVVTGCAGRGFSLGCVGLADAGVVWFCFGMWVWEMEKGVGGYRMEESYELGI